MEEKAELMTGSEHCCQTLY